MSQNATNLHAWKQLGVCLTGNITHIVCVASFPLHYFSRVLLLQHVYAQVAAEAEGARGPGASVWLHHHAQRQQQAPPQAQRQHRVQR